MSVCDSASRSYSKFCRRAYRAGRHPTTGEGVYEFPRLDLYGVTVFRSGYKGSHVLSRGIPYPTAESAIAGGM